MGAFFNCIDLNNFLFFVDCNPTLQIILNTVPKNSINYREEIQ